MEAAGYEFGLADKLCQPDAYAQQFQNPYCYQPYGWLGRWALKTEIALERRD
jgi:hypothetical protein